MPIKSSKKLGIVVFMIAALSVFMCSHAEAKVEIVQVDPSIESLFVGTILYTSPEGIPDVLVPEGTVPALMSGSILEVFDGMFRVVTGPGDTVTLTCGDSSIQVSGGSSATLSCSQTKGGKIVIHKGSVKILGLSDETMSRMQWDGVLYAGQSYSIRQGLTSEVEDVEDTKAAVKALLDGQNVNTLLDPTKDGVADEKISDQILFDTGGLDRDLIARLQSLPTGDIFKSTALFYETQQLAQIPDSTNIEQI